MSLHFCNFSVKFYAQIYDVWNLRFPVLVYLAWGNGTTGYFTVKSCYERQRTLGYDWIKALKWDNQLLIK